MSPFTSALAVGVGIFAGLYAWNEYKKRSDQTTDFDTFANELFDRLDGAENDPDTNPETETSDDAS